MTPTHDTPAPDQEPPVHRQRDAAATRAALLAAASLRFAADGYHRTSLRDIASDVGVNMALVKRYFGSKDALFEEVSAWGDPLADLLATPLTELPDRIVDQLMTDPMSEQGPHPLLALLRSAGYEEACVRLRDQVSTQFAAPLADRLDGDDKQLRAELLAAWMLGLVLLRSVIATPAFSEATQDQLAPLFRRSILSLLDVPAGPA